MKFIKEVIRFIRGKIYYRFSLALIAFGVGLVNPDLWEYIISAMIWVFGTVHDVESEWMRPNYEENMAIPSLVIGSVLIIAGISNFTYWYKKDLYTTYQSNNIHLNYLIDMWANARAIDQNPNEAKNKDVINAINLLNATAFYIDDSRFEPDKFKELRGDDFLKLYNQLNKANYKIKINGKMEPTKLLLNDRAHKLNDQLCQK